MDTHEGIVETTVTVHHGVCMDPNDEIVAIAWHRREIERERWQQGGKVSYDFALSRKATCPAWNISKAPAQ
jgi:hypothetical protein